MSIEIFGKTYEKHTKLVGKIVHREGTRFIEHSNAIDNVAKKVVEMLVLDADKLAQSTDKQVNAETTAGFTPTGGE